MIHSTRTKSILQMEFYPVDTNQLVRVKEKVTVHFLVIVEFSLWVANRRWCIEIDRQLSRKETLTKPRQEAIFGHKRTLTNLLLEFSRGDLYS